LKLFYLTLQSTKEGQAAHAHVHEILKGLCKRGWQAVLFEPRYPKSHSSPSLFKRFWEFIVVQVRLWWQFYSSDRPSILYIRWHFATWPTALLARFKKIPTVQEVNGPYGDLFAAWPWTRHLQRFFVFLMRSQLLWADAVIAVTPRLGDWAREEGVKKPIVVIPNGANVEIFSPDGQIDPLVEGYGPYVIFFGALAPWQGIEVMLEAVEVSTWPQQVKLVIVGEGALYGRVAEAARRNSRIVFLGPQPYTHMPGLIRGSLAVLVPQTDDRSGFMSTGLFPLKLFEGMACGVPVVVTDFPGMADLVRKEKCGLVIPPKDAKALADAVRYLYDHPEARARMGTKGREIVVRDHSWDARAAETDRLLRRLLGIVGKEG